MTLNPQNTDFLILASHCNADDLLDLKALFSVLKFINVPQSNIGLLIAFDDAVRENYLGDTPAKKTELWRYTKLLFLNQYLKAGIHIFYDQNAILDTILSKFRQRNLFVIVAGHGHKLNGICLGQNITPSLLLSTIRKFRRIRTCAGLLAQCFSGNFNFTPAQVPKELGAQAVLMGAANSLSSFGVPIKIFTELRNETLSEKILSVALNQELPPTNTAMFINPYLFVLMEWLINPVDIDGDGKYSLIDCFKFLASEVEIIINRARAASLALALKSQYSSDFNLDLLPEALDKALSISQTPWVLNSRLGQKLTWTPNLSHFREVNS